MIPLNRSQHLLYPPMLQKLTDALVVAHNQGLMAFIFEGYRSHKRQAELFAQGRTTPGNVVTWVGPGDSWHQYGIAVDLVFDGAPLTPGIQWSWEGGYADQNGDNYDKLAKILKGFGFEWLGDSNIERAHFQMTYGFTIKEAKKITDDSGVLGFWSEIDKKWGV